MLGRWKPGERAYIDAWAERQPHGPFCPIRAGGKSRLHTLSAGLVALALLVAPDTDKADCGAIANRYTAAVGRVVDAMQNYAKCVSASDKRDDCAAEMQALDNAHDDFAEAVADAKSCQ
jgi:hypothetical protein